MEAWMHRKRWNEMLCAFAMLSVCAGRAAAQDENQPPQPERTAQMTEVLARAGSGHSPTTDEIRTVEAMPGLSDVKVAKALEPLLDKALANEDAAVRAYGLAMLVGMQTLPDTSPAADGTAAAPSDGSTAAPAAASATPSAGVKNASLTAFAGQAAFKGDVGKVLLPLGDAIGRELLDDDSENRLLAANALGGFTPNPPSAVYAALLGYLKRDDAIGPVGLAVVGDLLQLGPVSDRTASAVAAFLHRSDQTPDDQANLVEEIAAKPNQSKLVNKAVLTYLDAGDPSLRARVILSLPALELAPEMFADTKARVDAIATGGQESLEVVNAAKAVSVCWTSVKMTTGCPIY